MGDNNWLNLEKLMTHETMESIFSSLKQLAQKQDIPFSVVLHGGEPLLLGPKKLKFLLHGLREVLSNDYPISIQTNGILITSGILDICYTYKASVAVSIDGPLEVNDKHRLAHNGTGTFQKVINGINLLRTHPNAEFLNAGLLAVVDPSSDPNEVYSFFKEMAVPSVDFIYKDGNHSNLPPGKASVSSAEYGKWMSELLEIYLQDTNPLPIRLLDDMLKVLLGGIVSKEGLGVTDFGILVIDTDGKLMKNDTLKSSFNGADKFKKPVNIKDNNLLQFLTSSYFQSYRKMQRPTSHQCLNCPELNVCGGGMILHRWKDENGFDNPSVYCEDQLYLIENMKKALIEVNINYE